MGACLSICSCSERAIVDVAHVVERPLEDADQHNNYTGSLEDRKAEASDSKLTQAMDPKQTQAMEQALDPKQTQASDPKQTQVLDQALDLKQTQASDPKQAQVLDQALEPKQTQVLDQALDPKSTQAKPTQALDPKLTRAKQTFDYLSTPLGTTVWVAKKALDLLPFGGPAIADTIDELYRSVSRAFTNIGGCEKLLRLVCWVSGELTNANAAGAKNQEAFKQEFGNLLACLKEAQQLVDKFSSATWLGRAYRGTEEEEQFNAVHDKIVMIVLRVALKFTLNPPERHYGSLTVLPEGLVATPALKAFWTSHINQEELLWDSFWSILKAHHPEALRDAADTIMSRLQEAGVNCVSAEAALQVLIRCAMSIEPGGNLVTVRSFTILATRYCKDGHEGRSVVELLQVLAQDVGLDALSKQRELDLESLQRSLKPPHYEPRIKQLLEHWVPDSRKWFVKLFYDWKQLPVEDPGHRALLIYGKPGIGKSTISAASVQQGLVHVHHFCRFNVYNQNSPVAMMKNIAFQLAAYLPEFRVQLAGIAEQLPATATVGDAFDELLFQPLSKLPAPDEPLIVLVDALDELDGEHTLSNPALRLIAEQLVELPDWMRFVLTSRPETHIRAVLGVKLGEPFVIRADDEAHSQDLKDYLRHVLSERMDPLQLDAAIGELVKKSEGTFVYVAQLQRSLLADKRQDRLTMDDIRRLPGGLFGMYQSYFEKHFPTSGNLGSSLDADARGLLEVLVAARQPVSLASLAEWMRFQDTASLQLSLGQRFGNLFEAREGAVYAFHKTVYDWLADRDRNPFFHVPREKGHLRMVELWREEAKRPPSEWSPYMIRHAIAHCCEAVNSKETAAHDRNNSMATLLGLLGNMRFWYHAAAMVDGGVLAGLLLDLQELGPAVKEVRDVVRWLRRDAAVMQQATDVTMVLQLACMTPKSSFIHQAARMCLKEAGSKQLPAELLNPPAAWPGLLAELCMSAEVTSVAFSPDGRVLASACSDAFVQLWNARTGERLAGLQCSSHRGGRTVVAFAPDGATLASLVYGESVRLWDVESGAQLAELGAGAKVVSLSPDSTPLAALSQHGAVWVWDTKTGQPSKLELGFGVDAIACAPNGEKVALAPEDKVAASHDTDEGIQRQGVCTVRVSDPQTDTYLTMKGGHEKPVTSLAFAPNSESVASASLDESVRVWDARTGALQFTMKGHKYGAMSVAFSPDSTMLASASGSGSVRLWDAKQGGQLAVLTASHLYTEAIAFSPDGTTLVSGRKDARVQMWDVQSVLHLAKVDGHIGGVTGAIFIPNVGPEKLHVSLLDADALEHIRSIDDVTMSQDGTMLATRYSAGGSPISLWGHNKQLHVLSGSETHPDMTTTWVVLSPNGATLAMAVGRSGTYVRKLNRPENCVHLWNTQTGTQRTDPLEHPSDVTSMAFTPDSATLAMAVYDGTIWLWDAKSGKRLAWQGTGDGEIGSWPQSARGGYFRSLAWSSDGTRLVAGRVFFGSSVFELLWFDWLSAHSLHNTGRLTQLQMQPEDSTDITSMALTPEGTKVATTSRSVRLWDAETGEQLGVKAGRAFAFTARGIVIVDGRRVDYFDLEQFAEPASRSWLCLSNSNRNRVAWHGGRVAIIPPSGIIEWFSFDAEQ